MSRSEMKRNAKARLGNGIFTNRWLMGVLVCIILGAITTAAGAVIPGLGAVIIVGPVTYGLKKMFLTQAREDSDMKIGDLFCGFNEDFGGTFLLGLMSGLFVILWSLLFLIPGIVKSYAYEMIYYIKADHPEYDWRTCLRESEKMMKGHKWDLWVAPYHEATKVQFYMDLCGERIHEHQAQPEWHDASQVSYDNYKDTTEENKKSWDPER